MATSVLQSDLAADLESRHAAVRAQVETQFAPLSESQLNWKPSETSWSVAECLHHLVASHDAYWPLIQAAIGSTAPSAPPDNRVKSTWMGATMLRYVDPKVVRKLKAPAIFAPSRSNLPGGAVDAFLRCHDALDSTIRNTAELDWHRIRVPSPVTRLLRWRLGDAYNILVTHAQRHVNQAMAVPQRDGWPAA